MSRVDIDRRIRKAQSRLPSVYGAERYKLMRQFNRIKRLKSSRGKQAGLKDRLKNLEQAIEIAILRRTRRRDNHPAAVYPPTDLPILEKKEEITAAIEKNRVLIISGETGSGKTTQIPKFCLDAGRGVDGVIGCTQPRRIAATTVARRIAEELNHPLGEAVGYKIRFRDQTSSDGFIKIMTDGILLAEIQTDPFLNAYDTLIVDEAHERSLNIDLTLGIVKRLLSRRRDLKLIVTSATIDTAKFSRAFNQAPIIEVSGRMYPVQVRYETPTSNGDGLDLSPVDMAVEAVMRIGRESRYGDILVFMPTEQDIRDTCRSLEGRCDNHTTIFPLFARLAGPEQSRVFARVPGRKIIVATNVAETSITIPGIRYVVDTGLARIPRYTPRSRCTLLPIDPISRSSADQRKGRCGRVADGVCVRLYSEEDYLSRPLFTPPEILRANLADVILRMIALRIGDVTGFPFIDPPPAKSIQDGYNLLLELGAIIPLERKHQKDRRRYRLTADGKMMARLPIDPRLACMLIEAGRCGCLAEVTIIAAALSIRDPRERPLELQQEADRLHAGWIDSRSDFVTLVNIWRWYETELAAGKSVRKMKRFCRDHFVSYRRMREWKDIHNQLCLALKESGLRVGALPEAGILGEGAKGEFSPRYAAVHRSILSGFLSNIACKKEKNIYSAAKGKEVMVFPGSGLFDRGGKWIVAAEMVLTSRLFARTVAQIDPVWLEPLAGDSCRYTYADPHWDRKKETVIANEQVSLFGLVIVPRRHVVYGRIDADGASAIFVENALVEGDLQQPLPFVRHNQDLIDQVVDMENRLRRRDLFIGKEALAGFYRNRLTGVWNTRLLMQKIKKTAAGFLLMGLSDLLRSSPDETELAGFPDIIQLGEGTYRCGYRYEPDGPADGVTVSIPAGAAAMVPIGSLDWLVPGMIAEKIRLLIKGLPKAHRQRLGPLPQVMAVITGEMKRSGETESLINVLGRFLYQRFGVHIPAAKWPTDSLPDYLKMRVTITDSRLRDIQNSRDPIILRRSMSPHADPVVFNAQKKRWERSGITRWDFGDIPEIIEIPEADGSAGVAYPALTVGPDQPKEVSRRLYQHWDRAVNAHVKGVQVLATLHLGKEMKSLKRVLKISTPTAAKASFFGGAIEVERQLFDKIVTILFAKNIRTEKRFYTCLQTAQPRLHQTGQALLAAVEPVLSAYHDVRTQSDELQARHLANPSIRHFIDGRSRDLDRLIPKNFILLYDTDRLNHLPVYIKAISVRAMRGVVNLEKDRRKAEKIKPFSEILDGLLDALTPGTSETKRTAIEAYFWMLETYKVSIFAQELKVPRPVSAKRLEEKLAELERMA